MFRRYSSKVLATRLNSQDILRLTYLGNNKLRLNREQGTQVFEAHKAITEGDFIVKEGANIYHCPKRLFQHGK